MSDDRQAYVFDGIENGVAPWPAGNRVHVRPITSEDEWTPLISGRRLFAPMEIADEPQIGDLVVFERWLNPAGKIWSGPPVLRQITDVWTHDGIAPGWVIVSLRPVHLAVSR